jgi:hypothetical protein
MKGPRPFGYLHRLQKSFFQDMGVGGVFSRSEDDGDDTDFISLYIYGLDGLRGKPIGGLDSGDSKDTFLLSFFLRPFLGKLCHTKMKENCKIESFLFLPP